MMRRKCIDQSFTILLKGLPIARGFDWGPAIFRRPAPAGMLPSKEEEI
jgi:hypothetical protein